MGKMPKDSRRDPESGAIVFKKQSKGKNVDMRVIRKIILEMYRVMSVEQKEEMKPKVRKMLNDL